MTYTAEGFSQFCMDAAGQFLQTAVVIDNEAVFCSSKCELAEQEAIPPEEIVAPSEGHLGKLGMAVVGGAPPVAPAPAVETEGTGQLAEDATDQRKNILKAKPLIDAFANIGVVCSIIRPDLDETGVIERSVSLAAVADIVVVDWALGKSGAESEGFRATQIIKGIISRDLGMRGRLRLIAIYTAEGIPGTILDTLFNDIGEFYPNKDKLRKDDTSYTIQNRFLKIVVLLKPKASGHIPGCPPVEFSALPGKLHQLFAELNRGLLPSVTLRAIAAIREGTHHLLAVLHKDLDPAFVGHRCLLPYPEDAEEFCEDLVAGEVRSILALAKIGAETAGKEQHEQWVASKYKNWDLVYDNCIISREQISNLLESGTDKHKSIMKEIKREYIGRTEKKEEDPLPIKITNITQVLHGEKYEGQKVNNEFSRLSIFKREAFGLRRPGSGWVPKLTLGTLLQRVSDSKLFLCLQPRCESVRFEPGETSRAYPFLEIGKGKKKEFIVVNAVASDRSADEQELFFEPKPKNQVIFEFKKPQGNSVIATIEGNLYVFTDAGSDKFYWLGDLKDPLAQNIVGKVSDAVGSVGINPYEWLRLQSSN